MRPHEKFSTPNASSPCQEPVLIVQGEGIASQRRVPPYAEESVPFVS